MTLQSANEIDDDAAVWAMRLGDGGNVPGLKAWLDGDARRAGALLRAQAALSFIDRARALDAEPIVPPTHRLLTRRGMMAGAGGGGLMAAGLALAVLNQGDRYTTGLGEIRRLPLRDGSVVEINTQSGLVVTLREGARDIVLSKGEAWFQVAKDASRPFTVRAGEARFRALGTAFSVRRLSEDQSEMLVTEGVVEAWRGQGQRVRVEAGSRIVLGPGLAANVISAPAAIERALAWRSGKISLDGLSLAEAAAEFNRYNRQHLAIENPSLADRKLAGLFRVDDPRSFAAAVAAAYGAHLSEDGAVIRLR